MKRENNVIVSIGRQYGSGGSLVAKELAKLMGVKYYDKLLLEESARHSGLSEKYFESMDERSPLAFSNILSSGLFSMSEYGSSFNDERIFGIVSSEIMQLAQKESAVVVGRCSDYLLRDRKGLITIFISSPMEARIREISAREHISEREAMNKIKRTDKERAAYYNFYTDKKWGDASSYNITIDSSFFGVEQTAKILHELVVNFQQREP